MLRTVFRPTFLVGLALVARGNAAGQEPAREQKPADAKIAASIGGDSISLEELDAKVMSTNMKVAQSLYDARRAALDDMITERLLAKEAAERGTSTDALLRERLAEKVTPVTDEEVEAYYNANQARMRGQPMEKVSPQIRQFLQTQRESSARQELLNELKAKAGVKITLEPPRVTVAVAATDPTRGPANAKVTVIEFSDFQ